MYTLEKKILLIFLFHIEMINDAGGTGLNDFSIDGRFLRLYNVLNLPFHISAEGVIFSTYCFYPMGSK